MKILIITLLILSSCSTSTPKTPFLISSSLKMKEENLKWKSFGPFSPEEAKAFMEERQQSVEELLQPRIDPYKGEDSTPDICKQENLPEVMMKSGEGWSLKELSFYSSKHMVLGLCANPHLLLKTKYQMLYCENKKEVYVIQFFYGDDMPWDIQIETKCR